MVRMRAWVLHDVSESPQKDRSARMCVRVHEREREGESGRTRKKETIVHSKIKKSPLKHCKWKRQKNGANLWIFERELACHISSEAHKT